MTVSGKLVPTGGPTGIVGESTPTRDLREQIARFGPFSSNVLITGPSGSGKELVARALHAQSPRAQKLFVPVDCASVTGELLASQLFGHLEGAFTGANCAALGSFRAADGGTLFLDEIGELELTLQAKLLRVIQERVVVPVGSHVGHDLDVRIVAATNRDLKQEVAAGRFREDLYFRLNVVTIHTLPLSDRREDIITLAATFLARMANEGLPAKILSPGAMEALECFPWPGNVRQLKNVLEQAVITSDGELITLPLLQRLLAEAGLPDYGGTPLRDDYVARSAEMAARAVANAGKPTAEPPRTRHDWEHVDGRHAATNRAVGWDRAREAEANWPTLSDLERDHIAYTLEHTYYNQTAAARLLGVTRQALIRKIKKYHIQLPSQRDPLPPSRPALDLD